MKLTFLYVPVSDLGAAVGFYGGELGLEEAWREGETTVAYWSADRGVQLMIDTEGHPAGPMYQVDDVARWQAEHAGLPIHVPAYAIPGGEVVGFTDPSGNVFYVFDQRTS